MAITIYGWRKPTLELELVEGGSLLANTKYYVVGFMRYNPYAYNSVGSPLSNVYEITTTSTARSIKITQKTYRDIQSFADNGDGKTLVNCTRHCLATGDVIKITDGAYAGSWTITKVNYNSFTINKAFSGSTATTCYTDSYRYNYPGYGRLNGVGMLYWIYTSSPFDENNDWKSISSRWTETVYQFVYGIQNPVIITTQPSANTSSGYENLQVRRLCKGIYKTVAEEYGLIHIDVQDNDTTTLKNIYDTVIAAGYEYSCFYRDYGVTQIIFDLFGSLVFRGTSTLSVSSAHINLYCSEMYHNEDASKIVFSGCLINLMPLAYTAWMKFTANNCVFYNRGSTVNYGSWIYGDDTIFYATPRQSYQVDTCDIPNLKYTNLATGLEAYYGIIQNKIYRDTDQGQIFQQSYNCSKLINCSIPPIFWVSLYGTGCIPDIYMMENCTVKRGNYLGWHFRLYTDTAGSYFNHHFKYLNVNVDAVDNNIKKCIHNYVIPDGGTMRADFYRRAKFYVKNQAGATIIGASITITDNARNTYTGTTDTNGYVYIDVMEQKTVFPASASQTNWVNTYDTYYKNFTITITKDGYDDEIIKLDDIYQTGYYDAVFNVSLNTIAVIYYNQKINGTIETEEISGSVNSSNSVSGTVKIDNITGDVETDI